MKQAAHIVLILFVLVGAVSADADITPIPQPVQSIFEYDICAPPCWMGLTPGESNSADVELLLEQHRELFAPGSFDGGPSRREDNGEYDVDPQTGLVRTGEWQFDVGQRREPFEPGDLSSRIEIRDSKVDLIVILSNDLIPLSQVLDRLGEPDVQRLRMGADSQTHVLLIYLELRLRIFLTQPTDVCRTSNLSDQLLVSSVLYQSPDYATRLASYYPGMSPQPNLIRYTFEDERDIADENWQSWIEGEVDMNCEEAWEGLPQPEVTPLPETTFESEVTP